MSAVDDERRSRFIIRGLGAYVFLSGLVSFCGWAFDVPRLTDWDDRGISIQPNTSIATTATGLALLFIDGGYRRAALVLGLVPGLIGAATLFEYATGIDLGIDTLLMFDRTWGQTGTLAPGRMGPPGSLSWTVTGLALLLITGSESRRLVPLFGLVVSSIAGLSLTGYLFGADPLYTVPWLTAIAFQTSTFLLAVGLGLVASVPEREPFRTLTEDSGAGLLARRTLVWMIVLPMVLGYLRIQGQRAGFFDTAMGTALLVLALIVIMCGVLWRSVKVVSARERELVTTDRALRVSETRLTKLLEQLPLGVGVFDLDGRLTIANPVLRRFTRERIPSHDPREAQRWRSWTSDGAPVEPSQWPGARALRGETVNPGMDFLYSDDERRDVWTRVSAAPFRDAHGAIVGAIWVVQDIDERKRAEDALAATERQLRLVADHAPVLIAHCDGEARYKFVNRAYAERFGLTPELVIGKRIPEVVGEEAYATFEGYVADVLAGQSVEFEIEIPYRTGGRQYMHVAYVPERNGDGAVVGLVAAIVNITERKRAEEALRLSEHRLRRQADELQEADRKKDEFLATLAHELRNPLAPLRTGLQILKHAQDDADVAERTRTTMERQVSHLVRLIDDLLDVSRITSGRIALTTGRVGLGNVVEQAISASQPAIDAHGHRLRVIAPPAPLTVEVDEARMVQVFSNLLNNAAKFTPPGGEITLAIARDGSEAVVSIRDTGVGIPPDMLAKVFDRFTQVDRSLERSHSGLGIGLSLVKGLVEMHGGSVEARSDGPGAGSEFVVRLAVVAPLAAQAYPPVAAEPMPISRRRILVVDDNIDAADALAMLLALDGHDTDTAHDGVEAIDKAAAWAPDVIFLDIGMPRLNGYDTCRRIRERPWGQGILLVALTGWGQDEDRRRSHEAGFDGHVVKPADADTLRKLLASLVAGA